MAKAGRKSKYEEINIAHRYSQLSERTFAILQARLDSKSKKEQDWAVEQLMKGYAKMLPQQVGGIDGQPIEISWATPQDRSLSPIVHADGPPVSTTAPSAG